MRLSAREGLARTRARGADLQVITAANDGRGVELLRLHRPGLHAWTTSMVGAGALGNIVLGNSQNPGIFGKVWVHGSNGATVGVQTDGGSMFIYRSQRDSRPVKFPLVPETSRDDFDGRTTADRPRLR